MRKMIKNGLPLLVTVFVLALVLGTVPAARAEVFVVEPGQTATVYLEYTDACAIDGKIEFSDTSIISGVQYDMSGSGMQGLVENGTIFLYAKDQTGVSGRIGVTVTIHSGATKGGCTITFRYAVTAPGSKTPGATQKVTHTVTVSTGEGGAQQPTDPPEVPTDPKDPSLVYADTTALRSQLNIAKKLTYYDYTKQSWAEVAQAVRRGENLLTSTDQKAVDDATAALKAALAKLVLMDYSALNAALEDASVLDEHEDLARLWSRFVQALENGRIQRTSGDQEAVDAAVIELNESKEALLKGLEELEQMVVVEKEVEVGVEPDYTFCNNKKHSVILLIMIISLAINLVLVSLIALYFIRKRKNQMDKTPLVEYDIEDDDVQINEDLLE